LLFFSMLCFAPAANAQHAPASQIDFVYFGSADCPYCRGWEAHDLPQLMKSKVFRQVRLTKITKEIGSPVPPASSFPEAIRQLREPIAENIEGAGSPMFAILADGHVVAGWRGSKKYSADQILGIIEQQEAQSRSGPAVRAAGDLLVAR
jgi:hypothetical protein